MKHLNMNNINKNCQDKIKLRITYSKQYSIQEKIDYWLYSEYAVPRLAKLFIIFNGREFLEADKTIWSFSLFNELNDFKSIFQEIIEQLFADELSVWEIIDQFNLFDKTYSFLVNEGMLMHSCNIKDKQEKTYCINLLSEYTAMVVLSLLTCETNDNDKYLILADCEFVTKEDIRKSIEIILNEKHLELTKFSYALQTFILNDDFLNNLLNYLEEKGFFYIKK